MSALIILTAITGISWLVCLIKIFTAEEWNRGKYVIALVIFGGITIGLLEAIKLLL